MNTISYDKAHCLATLEQQRSAVSTSILGRNRRREETRVTGIYGDKCKAQVGRQVRGIARTFKLARRHSLDRRRRKLGDPARYDRRRAMKHDPVALTNWKVDYKEDQTPKITFSSSSTWLSKSGS
ncbi:hypothetical protein IEO21_02068 [Rhodonia placenta]|uniref:Uncharacterized protein n=1 Tax=Rhodonia placenta TaxID=104341 RepID=A0A8H7P8A3_9APHY|nr:hypothetical protein IEO21_02068 [Postia placenta]